jgi:nucleoid DNA-binding protein
MKKEELVVLVKELFELGSKKEAEAKLAEVDTLVEAIAEKLEPKKKVTVGKYLVVEKKHVEAKHTDARVGRNPRTGESLQIPAKDVPAHDVVTVKATKALNK